MSSVKIIARITGVVRDEPSVGDPLSYKVYYEYSEPLGPTGGITNGGTYVEVGEYTESEVLAIVQQRVVESANLNTSWEYNFSLDDVRGGWF
jgi:hypothetical protein